MNLKKIKNPFGGLVYYKESTTSTMAEAKANLDSEDINGSIFITDFQSSGIGRLPGRKWLSKTGDNLMFTLALNKSYLGHGYVTIPLKAGLALANTISSLCNLDTKVKWPNDVVINDKKVSGILCQSNKKTILIGIGLNVNQVEFDDSISSNTTSLSLLTGNGFNIEMVLSNFLEEFHRVLNSKDWLDKLNENLYKAGEIVDFYVGSPEKNELVSGTLVGLDKNGKVLIKNSENIESSYISGEFKFS